MTTHRFGQRGIAKPPKTRRVVRPSRPVRFPTSVNLYRFITLVTEKGFPDRQIAIRWEMDQKNFHMIKHGLAPVPRLDRLAHLAEILSVERFFVIEAALGTPAERVHEIWKTGRMQEKLKLLSPDIESGVSLLEEEREFNDRIIEAIGDAYILSTPSGQIRRTNGTAIHLADLPGETLAGRNLLDFFPAAEAGRVLGALRAVASTRQPMRLEALWQDWNRKKIEIELTLTSIARGGETLVQAVARDMSGRKRAEDEIRLRTELVERIMDNVQLGMHLVDRDLRIVYWNRARELGPLGFRSEDVAGKPILDRVEQKERPALELELRTVLEQGRIIQRVRTSTIAGVERQYRVTRQPIRNREGVVTHVLTIGEEIVV